MSYQKILVSQQETNSLVIILVFMSIQGQVLSEWEGQMLRNGLSLLRLGSLELEPRMELCFCRLLGTGGRKVGQGERRDFLVCANNTKPSQNLGTHH